VFHGLWAGAGAYVCAAGAAVMGATVTAGAAVATAGVTPAQLKRGTVQGLSNPPVQVAGTPVPGAQLCVTLSRRTVPVLGSIHGSLCIMQRMNLQRPSGDGKNFPRSVHTVAAAVAGVAAGAIVTGAYVCTTGAGAIVATGAGAGAGYQIGIPQIQL